MNINDFPEPFIPKKLPITFLREALMRDMHFMTHLVQNGRKLSEFVGYLQNLPNPNILISSLTLQEAVLSSRIEGTIATIDDVVNQATTSDTIKNDIVEIENYCDAIRYGHQELFERNRGLSKNLIKQLHVLLLEKNVRGAGKTPGEFKKEQNFIKNTVLGNFTPLPPILTDEYIDNLVDYIANENEISELLQAAILHAQFEIIHPFKDGNGRVGRLLIPLFLYWKRVLPYPVFYISRYFAENNDAYKERLSGISKGTSIESQVDGWKNWLYFFFDGIASESKRHIETSKQILNLYKEMIGAVNRTDMIALIDLLFDELRLQPKDAIEKLSLPQTSVYRELQSLSAKAYLTRSGTERKTLYVFTKLIDIVQQ